LLTPEQKATLKSYINATPELAAQPNNSDGAFAIAAALNAVATPTFYVWRTSVSQDEITQNGFDWVRVDNLSVGKARIWEWMFDNATRVFNPSKANVREGIVEAWKGTAADVAVQAAVFTHCQRPATAVEKLFATGAGTSVVNGLGPATMERPGSISYQDVEEARNS
jgi:hypothetical protein